MAPWKILGVHRLSSELPVKGPIMDHSPVGLPQDRPLVDILNEVAGTGELQCSFG